MADKISKILVGEETESGPIPLVEQLICTN